MEDLVPEDPVPEDTFVVVSDREGFVGAFASASEAEAALLPYAGIPLIGAGYPRRRPPGTEDPASIWILPYRGNGAVAFASDDKARVEEVQRALLRVELTFPDDPEYWEHELGAVAPAAQRRLAEALQVLEKSGEDRKDQETVERFVEYAARGEPPPPPARIDLLESVVPTEFPPA